MAQRETEVKVEVAGGTPFASRPAPPDDAGQSTAQLVQARLAQQVGRLRRSDPIVRERLPGGVHQIRKAIRRLRDGLATARPFLDKAEVAAVRDELKWLSHQMGAARDAEVQEARLREHLDSVGHHAEETTRTLSDASAAAQLDAAETLGLDRYSALLERLDDLVASPPWREKSAQSIDDAYLPRVKHDWKRLAKRVAAVDDTDDATDRADALHECRKAAKRLRYAVEPLVPVVGKPAKRTKKDVQRLQKILGDHHDAVVARRTAGRLAADASPAEAFALGVIHERETDSLVAREADVERAWRRAKRRKRRRWFW